MELEGYLERRDEEEAKQTKESAEDRNKEDLKIKQQGRR